MQNLIALQLTKEQLINIYYIKWGLICPSCNTRVFDPDKGNKNQVHITDKCPSCGVDPGEWKKEQKREQKKNRKNKIKNKNNHKK